MKCLILLCALLVLRTVNAESYIIPTADKYSDFLVEPYKPNAPSVVVFKDPNCGYCIRALKRLDKYKHYNMYMFWSPILGDSSKKKVAQILQCEAPVSGEVFIGVINRAKNYCKTKSVNAKHIEKLNMGIVNNYKPQSVPSYYFGGQKVHLSSLNRFKAMTNFTNQAINLDWSRYKKIKLNQLGHQGLANVIVFIPQGGNKGALQEQLQGDYRYNWYIVDGGCKSNDCVDYKLSEELRLLFNIKPVDKLVLVINGMVIESDRLRKFKLNSLVLADI